MIEIFKVLFDRRTNNKKLFYEIPKLKEILIKCIFLKKIDILKNSLLLLSKIIV